MSLRKQLGFFLILLSLLGVLGSGFFVLQTAITDKKSYVTELNSVLGPQVKDSVDQKIQTLLIDLREFSRLIESKASAARLEGLKQRLQNVEAITMVIAGRNISVQLDPAAQLIELKPPFHAGNENQLTPFNKNIYLFKTAENDWAAVQLNPAFFKSSFELARGKQALLVNDRKILFANGNSRLPAEDYTPQDLTTQETYDPAGKPWLINSSSLNTIKNSFVLIVSPQVTWKDLMIPLFKSSISLLLVLIMLSIVTAYSISGSLAGPIEELAHETTKIGSGNWSSMKTEVNLKGPTEIKKLSDAFNHMIANLKNREQELKVAQNKIVQSESLAAVGRMSSGIAHEVKNPLASVLAYCQLLERNFKKEHQDPAQLQNYVQLIADDTRRASRIITDLLTFSRQKEIKTEKIRISDFITEISPKLKALCESAQIEFSLNSSPEVFVQMDPDQIYQVLLNLTQNSVQALQESLIPKKISLASEISDGQLTLTLTDNGPGIPPDVIGKIFEPFFSTKKTGEGTGLGLAICYGIIQQHGGSIVVDSTPNQNTRFQIKLPVSV